MAANKKLSGVLAGRSVTGVAWQGDVVLAQLDDGSVITVQTGTSASAGTAGASGAALAPGAAAPLGRIRGVRQRGTTLDIDYEDCSTLTLRTAEPTSSVVVRARDHTLEYAD